MYVDAEKKLNVIFKLWKKLKKLENEKEKPTLLTCEIKNYYSTFHFSRVLRLVGVENS